MHTRLALLSALAITSLLVAGACQPKKDKPDLAIEVDDGKLTVETDEDENENATDDIKDAGNAIEEGVKDAANDIEEGVKDAADDIKGDG